MKKLKSNKSVMMISSENITTQIETQLSVINNNLIKNLLQ